jgi:hypothetical protein
MRQGPTLVLLTLQLHDQSPAILPKEERRDRAVQLGRGRAEDPKTNWALTGERLSINLLELADGLRDQLDEGLLELADGRACRGVVRDKGCYPCEEDTVKLQVKDRLLISLWKSRSQNISKRAMRVVDVFARR